MDGMRSLTVHIYIYTFPPRNLLPSLLQVVTSSLSAARPNSPNDEIDYAITEERQDREREGSRSRDFGTNDKHL